VFGPRYAPVTARLVEEAVQASVGSYDALVVAGFSFDPEAAFLEKSPPAGIRLFRMQIAPDVLSRPFQPGEHERITVKVIDVRGNEVIVVREVFRESVR